jgi:hypothetical protein
MMCAKDLGKDSCQGDSGVSARMCSWAWYRGDMGVPTRISRAFILVVHPPTIKSEKWPAGGACPFLPTSIVTGVQPDGVAAVTSNPFDVLSNLFLADVPSDEKSEFNRKSQAFGVHG